MEPDKRRISFGRVQKRWSVKWMGYDWMEMGEQVNDRAGFLWSPFLFHGETTKSSIFNLVVP